MWVMIPYTELDEKWGQVKAADRHLETAEGPWPPVSVLKTGDCRAREPVLRSIRLLVSGCG
jgi:hypothetical protein